MESSTTTEPTTLVNRATLHQLVVKLLQRKGMFVAEAEIVADRMIEADQRCHYCVGVSSLPEYLEVMDLGDIDPRARVITITETPAMAVLDGSTGMGHVAMTNGMLTAVEKADQSGTGTVIIRNSRPGGSLCGIARLAAGKGLIGLVMSSFEQTACGGAGNPGVAWAVPAPDGRAIADSGDRQSAAGDEVAALCSLLSAGLAGADPLPRKRKAVRSANVVEYCLMAISPAKLGSRDAFFSKWTSLWSAAASSDTSQVPLQASTAIQLAELAAKIKFAVDW